MSEIPRPPEDGEALGFTPLEDVRLTNAAGTRRLKWSANKTRKIASGDYWTYGRVVALVLDGRAVFTTHFRDKQAGGHGQGRVG